MTQFDLPALGTAGARFQTRENLVAEVSRVVAQEAAARGSADTAEQNARIAADTAEQAARIAGDASLQTQVDALTTGVTIVGKWAASSGAFPTTRPNGDAIQPGDAWVVTDSGTVDGEAFAVPDRIIAIKAGGGATFSANWVRSAYSEQLGGPIGEANVTTAGGTAARPLANKLGEFLSVFDVMSEGLIAKIVLRTIADSDAAECRTAVHLAVAEAEKTNGSGILFFPAGRYIVDQPIIVSKVRVSLFGQGGSGPNTGGTDIRGHHTAGPVLRVKGVQGVALQDFAVSSTSTRRLAAYAGGSNPNCGIWIEADDEAGEGVDEFFCQNVWSHNQPGDGWIIVGGGYSAVINRCGANFANGHGLVISSGAYTGRTNTRIAGVMEVNSWSSRWCKGHGMLCGTEADGAGPQQIRVLIRNMDNYNNATTAGLLVEPYDSYFLCDNARIADSAFNGGDVNGALCLGGRNIFVQNTRLLDMGAGQAPIKILGTYGAADRASDNVQVLNWTLPEGSFTSVVEVEPGASRCTVVQVAPDGTFSGLVSGDVLEWQRLNVKAWFGPFLIGKTADDDTTVGVRLSDAGLISAVRTGNASGIFDRSDTGDVVLLRRGGTNIGSLYVSSTAVGLYGDDTDAILQREGGAALRCKANAVNLSARPTYADNAAALSGGLVPGDLYIRTGHGLDAVV